MKSTGLHVSVSDASGRQIAPGLSRWLTRVAPARARGQVNIALISDARVRSLNKRYRRRDTTTDVLSFPCALQPKAPGSRPRCLGDIVIARGVARRQATAAGHDQRTELRILALHGLLHLLGYDHHRDDGTMARLERRLLRLGGLHNGLIERSRP